MTLEEHLRMLAKQAKNNYCNIVTADEVINWPSGRLDKFIKMGVLIPTSNAVSIKCPGCDEGHFVEPIVDILADGKMYIHILCRQEGRDIPIDPDSLKQWEIVPEKLKELGYWPQEPENRYISFQEAAGILTVSKGTVSKWARAGKLEDNSQSGQARKLLLSSVLLLKHELEGEILKEDVLDLRRDIGRIPD